MVGLGMTMLVTLWGIARVTGAFNTLYTANESASYAALSASRFNEINGRIEVKCLLTNAEPGVPDTVCEETGSGAKQQALVAADQVMRQSLAERPFGLCYDGSDDRCNANEVRLLADFPRNDAEKRNWQGPSIKVFNMDKLSDPRLCRNSAGYPAGQGLRSKDYATSNGEIICWGLSEYGQVYNANLSTGVITRAQVDLEFLPGCLNASLCPTADIRVASSASQDQPVKTNYLP